MKLNKSVLLIQKCVRKFIAARRGIRKIETATRTVQNACFAWLAWRWSWSLLKCIELQL
ncbi:hypothetical protein T08_3950 [Trichinella sp. T8]|nr:hypothetical protein T08_3950 [Trichinella sp. T8]